MRNMLAAILLVALLAGCISTEPQEKVVEMEMSISADATGDLTNIVEGMATVFVNGYQTTPDASKYILNVKWTFIPIAKITIPGDAMRDAAAGTMTKSQLKSQVTLELYLTSLPPEVLNILKQKAGAPTAPSTDAQKQNDAEEALKKLAAGLAKKTTDTEPETPSADACKQAYVGYSNAYSALVEKMKMKSPLEAPYADYAAKRDAYTACGGKVTEASYPKPTLVTGGSASDKYQNYISTYNYLLTLTLQGKAYSAEWLQAQHDYDIASIEYEKVKQ